MRRAVRRTRDAVDLPDLSGEGDDVRGIPDELERGRPIQTVCDDGECAVPVDLDELAGVRHRITRVNIRVDCAVREGRRDGRRQIPRGLFPRAPGRGIILSARAKRRFSRSALHQSCGSE